MRQIVILLGLVFGFFVLTPAPTLRAEPEVTEFFDTAEEDYSDPSSVAAEMDSPPGERAPEDLPMDDTPGVDGIAV